MESSPVCVDQDHPEEITIRDQRTHRRSKRSRNVQMEIDNLYKAVPQLHKVFNVIGKIGEGTFSAVYLGEAKMLDGGRKRFALKRLIPTSHPARIAAELQCLTIAGGRENVMGATYCFRREGEVVIVMPYMEHQPIGEIIGLLSFEEVRLYIYNLLKALKHIHEFGIIHRDIKFNNFLYNRRAQTYSLVDFGLAQGTADTKIELLKVVKQRAGGKKAPRAADTPAPASTPAPSPNTADHPPPPPPPPPPQPEQKPPAPPRPSSSSSNTTTVTPTTATVTVTTPASSSPSPGKQVARPATTTTTTTATTSDKHTKELPRLNRTPRPVFGERNLNSVPSAPTAAKVELVKPSRPESLVNRRVAPAQRRGAAPSRRAPPAASQAGAPKPAKAAAVNPTLTCNCFQTERICNICMSRKKQVAPRAGTPGFRAPEVLTCCPNQGTAIDVWSAGVILLSLLSNRYPFFKGSEDLVSLTQIMILRGSRETIHAAKTFGKAVVCSRELPRQDLRALCQALRGHRPVPDAAAASGEGRPKEAPKDRPEDAPEGGSVTASPSARQGPLTQDPPAAPLNQRRWNDHHLPVKKQHRGWESGDGARNPAHKAPRLEGTATGGQARGRKEEEEEEEEEEEDGERGWGRVPDEAYELLDRLLDLNPATRVTASQALLHPLFRDLL